MFYVCDLRCGFLGGRFYPVCWFGFGGEVVRWRFCGCELRGGAKGMEDGGWRINIVIDIW